MRARAAGALAFFLVALLPTGHAAEVDVTLVEDGAGDVLVTTPDGNVPPQSVNEFRDVDLRGVGVLAEDDVSVTFFVQVESLEQASQNPLPFSDPNYYIHFLHGEQAYRLRVFTSLDNPLNGVFDRAGGIFVRLEQEAGEGQYRPVSDGEGVLDFGGNRVTATIPRAAIVDHNQAPLSLGDQLHDIWAEAESMGWFAFPVGQTQQGGEPVLYAGPPRAFDEAPDDRGALPDYIMTTGAVKQKGGLVAVSADPVRWTNGEASTLSFSATVTNTADEDIPVSVSVDKAKPEWTVAFSDSLTVPRGQSLNVTFLVTIPFSHNHGNIHLFEAVFESLDGTHYAATDLGVYWPAVPQPAGHHDTIWLHSRTPESQDGGFFSVFGSGTHVWMSAIQDEETDERIDVPAMATLPPNPFTQGKGIAFWRVALEPPLRMGLDFRPEDLGTMELGLSFPVAVVDPQVRVELSHIEMHERDDRRDDGYGEETMLASARSTPLAGAVSGDQGFTLELAVTSEADDIPYGTEANLILDIIVEATFIAGLGPADPGGTAPKLRPDATWMQLPLNEYVEPVDLTFQTDGSLELLPTADGQQRDVNAGRTVVYIFDVGYSGSNTTTFRTLVTGTNAEWAQIVGDEEFTLEPGTSRALGLAVKAPSGTSAGERADLTLTVMSVENAAVQAGINTLTTVVSGTDIPDEADRQITLDEELTTKKDAPGLGPVVLLGALLVMLRRR